MRVRNCVLFVFCFNIKLIEFLYLFCRAINKIQPGSISSIYTGSLPFRQMENIVRYLDACKNLGLNECNMFLTIDLFEGKDPAQVLTNFNALAKKSRSISSFSGPYLNSSSGPTLSSPQPKSPVTKPKAAPV